MDIIYLYLQEIFENKMEIIYLYLQEIFENKMDIIYLWKTILLGLDTTVPQQRAENKTVH